MLSRPLRQHWAIDNYETFYVYARPSTAIRPTPLLTIKILELDGNCLAANMDTTNNLIGAGFQSERRVVGGATWDAWHDNRPVVTWPRVFINTPNMR